MRIREYAAPRGHVVVDDLLPAPMLASFLESLRALEPRMTVGMVRRKAGFEKSDIKENRVVFLDATERERNAQHVYTTLRDAVWSPTVLDVLEAADEPLFQVLQYTDAPSIQISRYARDGHYGYHRDVGNKCNLTVLYFACVEPQAFTGGNFVIDHAGRKKTVHFKSNRLLIFPSSTLHRVTPVRGGADRFECARFSLQIWPAIVPGKTRGPRAMQALRREDQARHPKRPTFAVSAGDLAGSEAFYRSLFKGESLPIEELELGAFGRLGGRLLANLNYLVRVLYPDLDFEARFQNVPGGMDEVATRIYLAHRDDAAFLELGYLIGPGVSRETPIEAGLFVRFVRDRKHYQATRTVKLTDTYSKSESQLKKTIHSAIDQARADGVDLGSLLPRDEP